MPKSKEYIASSDESHSEDDYTPKKKKAKPEKKEKPKAAAAEGDGDDDKMQLSRMRFVNVSEFRGKKLVNIREYYEADGELKPGRKGISLSIDQWKKLKTFMDAIDEQLE